MSDGPGPDLGRTGPAAGGDRPDDGGSATVSPAVTADPGRTSATVALLVAVAAVLAVGVTGGFPVAALLSAAGGAALAWSVSLLATGDPVRVALGATVGAAAAVEVVAAGALGGVVAWSLWVGVFGVALARFRPDSGRLFDGVSVLAYGLVPLWVATLLAVVVRPAATALTTGAAAFGVTGEFVLTTLAVLVVATTVSVRAALGVLPFAALAPRSTADRPGAAVERGRRWLLWVARLAVVSVPVAAVVEGTGAASGVTAVVGAPPVRMSLAAAAGGGCAVTVTVLVLRWVGGSLLERSGHGMAAGVGVALTAAVVVARGPLLSRVLAGASPSVTVAVTELRALAGGPATVLFLVAAGLVAVVVTLFLLLVLVQVGVVPRRTAAPALGTAGLLAGVVLAADGLPAAVAVGGVASAMVVWDLGEYAVGIGEEVPGGAPRVEAVHAAGSLAVGAAVTALVAGGHAAVAGVEPSGAPAVAALAAALVGALALSALLRG